MTLDQPDAFDAHLQNLFTGTHPAAGFEQRLVNSIRQQQRMRLSITPQVKKTAIAAAAMLAVGAVGYYGNRAIISGQQKVIVASATSTDSAQQSDGMAIVSAVPAKKVDTFDFGGGSNASKNWLDHNSAKSTTTRGRTLSPAFNMTIYPPRAGLSEIGSKPA